MIVHIIEKDGNEVGIISYCKKYNIDFMGCCIRFCNGENFDEILGLNPEQIKIIHLERKEIKNG